MRAEPAPALGELRRKDVAQVAPVSPASATLGSQARRTPPIPPPRISAAVWLPSTER